MAARIFAFSSAFAALACASLALEPRIPGLEPIPLVGDAIVGRKTWNDEKVAAVFKQAKSDPEVLWKLRAAPMDKIFDRLVRLWLDAGGECWSEILVNGPGFDEQWEEVEQKAGRVLSNTERQSIIARRILNTHDQFGHCVRPRVERLCETFRRRQEIGKGAGKRAFIMARKEAIEMLKLALIRRDHDGIDIIDAFLRCPDERDPAQNNFVEGSVPHWALWALTERCKNSSERLSPKHFSGPVPAGFGGPIPSDVEAARTWWELHSFWVSEFPEPYREPKWSNKKISAAVVEARSNPRALHELGDAPLTKTFDTLMHLWKEDRQDQQAKAAPQGAAAPRHFGSSPVRTGREARKLLERHADWEKFTVSKLDRLKELFDTQRGPGKAASRKELMAAYEEASDILDFAVVHNGNEGYRVIASFLSAPDSIHPHLRGQVKLSPAALARDALATRLVERWNESIPGDIAGARAWWAENQGRFAGNATQRKPAIPGAKGYSRDLVRVIGSGRVEPVGALTAYIDSIEDVLRAHFSEQTEPDQFGFLVTLEPGKLPKHDSFYGSKEICALLDRSKAPEVTGGPVRVVFKAKVAGGWRYAKTPKDPQDENLLDWCGTWGGDDDLREVAILLLGDQF